MSILFIYIYRNFIINYKQNTIDFSQIQFDLSVLGNFFNNLKNKSNIMEVKLKIYDDNLTKYVAQRVASNNYLKKIEIIKEGEIANYQTITINKPLNSVICLT